MGRECFAELARDRAQVSDVVVVNTHLYGIDVAALGAIMPEHEVIVFDEAHGLEDIMSDTVGIEIAPGRFLSRECRRAEHPGRTRPASDRSPTCRRRPTSPSRAMSGQRLTRPLCRSPIVEFLEQARLVAGAHERDTAGDRDLERRRPAATAAGIGDARPAHSEYVDAALSDRHGTVAFVSGSADNPRLEIAPLDVGPTMRTGVWDKRTAILTSATIPASLVEPGRTAGRARPIRSTSAARSTTTPKRCCTARCSCRRRSRRASATRSPTSSSQLIAAAGGRTLALFTSWAALDHAVAAVRDRVDVPILTQRDLPKPALVQAPSPSSSETCLFATTGLFQGVDVPGATLSLVVIDKLPFPRPDDPLLSARRELLGSGGVRRDRRAQRGHDAGPGVRRLIRTADDRGVVAVLDPRLGTARYRWDIVRALPPMKRTRDRDEVDRFLRDITGQDTVGDHA